MYGIDAHLVQVEVDVGTGRMEDFNVVGLPDNAVKESRRRVKSALRNCGFAFPCGQGVRSIWRLRTFAKRKRQEKVRQVQSESTVMKEDSTNGLFA